MPAPTTQKTWRVSLTIDGRDCGVWDKKSGGKIGSPILTYPPGGMEPQISLPGATQTVDTITISRYYDRVRDHDNLLGFLLARSGKGRAVVKQRPLDDDGNGYGRSIVTTGRLQSVEPPATDNESDTPAMLTLEIAPDGNVTVA
jgi:hypothetical protein